MQNTNIWFDRKFEFDLPAWMFPMIVERLRGAPARLEEKIRGMDHDVLVRREGDGWTILEQIGHLTVVEDLWNGRMKDFREGKTHLRPADLNNTRTKESNFNESDPDELLRVYRESRGEFVRLLDEVEPTNVEQGAHHPRLDKPMRIIDLAYFAAEHDDHHLAKMTDLIKKFSM